MAAQPGHLGSIVDFMRGAHLKGFCLSLTAHVAVGATVLVAVNTNPPVLLGSGIEGLTISYESGLPGGGLSSAPSMHSSIDSPPLLIPTPSLPAIPQFRLSPSPSKSRPTVNKLTAPAERVAPPAKGESASQRDSCPQCSAGIAALGQGNGEGMKGGVQGVAPVSVPKPPYPWAARRAGFQGRVLFDITIAADGSVSAAHVTSSSGREDCDHAARETILERWRFQPATRFGRPVEWQEQVAVVFQLH